MVSKSLNELDSIGPQSESNNVYAELKPVYHNQGEARLNVLAKLNKRMVNGVVRMRNVDRRVEELVSFNRKVIRIKCYRASELKKMFNER